MIGGHEIAGSEVAGSYNDTRMPVLGNAVMELEAFGVGSITADGVPVITASRLAGVVTIDVDNLTDKSVRIWKADGHRNNFTLVDDYPPEAFPIELSGLTGNPKFKAAFVVAAGQTETVNPGRRSSSKFTIE